MELPPGAALPAGAVGIFAAQQLALVVFRICWQGAAGMGLASHYYFTMQIFAYPGFYLLTGLAAGLATHNSRRAQRVHLGYAARHPGAKVRGQGHHHRRRRGRLCCLAVCLVHR
ncbi:MAG: hypothetical protein EP147_02765 [Subdoligranulum sp.]|nr:hypothetical protein [Subdoligranulum sp.]